jgi:hypothetical protein
MQIHDPVSGIVKTYCGYSTPPSFTSKGNVVYLLFRTDLGVTAAGFEFVYYTNATAPTGK